MDNFGTCLTEINEEIESIEKSYENWDSVFICMHIEFSINIRSSVVSLFIRTRVSYTLMKLFHFSGILI